MTAADFSTIDKTRMNFFAAVEQAITASSPERKMALFGPLHLTILLLTVAVPYFLSRLTRRQERVGAARYLAVSIAVILIVNRILSIVWGAHMGTLLRWQDALPMHLCDWASFAVIVALVWRGQLAYELAYLWGLAGTLQAVLTPDLAYTFPNPFFIGFFVDHCGIIVSVLFLTWGLGMRPRPGVVLRGWGWTQVYVLCAGLVDWLTDTNYGYLLRKPLHGSLMDFLGPGHWYVLSLEGLSLVFFTVLYAPFWWADRRRPVPLAAAS